jgi:RNA-directed DNA polymerase
MDVERQQGAADQLSLLGGEQAVVRPSGGGEAGSRSVPGEERQASPVLEGNRALAMDALTERICERENLNRAYKRVKANRGSPGVDGMRVDELGPWLKVHREELVASLLDGSYRPLEVRGVEIPKTGGGVRQLGIPTVVDRLVQQAILQVLDPLLDPTFSESSYGFRPGRSAHQALSKASEYVAEGYAVVVDMDLEKFFDRVNHDVMMNRVARRIADKRLLKIIRRFLEAGILKQGVVVERYEGTPQGGPLEPPTQSITSRSTGASH